MNKSFWIALLLVFCSVGLVASSWAYWTADGIALCTATGYQQCPMVAPDGGGGAIFTWQDNRSGNLDIYIQRANSLGLIKWTADGVALCTATGNQSLPKIIADGAGGAIVAWEDYRGANRDIYAQLVSATGVVQWTIDGIAICTATGLQQYPAITSDGAGGAIITWYDYRSGEGDIYAQRVNPAGAVQWTANGVAICAASGQQSSPAIVSDGVGGAVITWGDGRNGSGNFDIYAQRVNSAGAVLWAPNGVRLCGAAESQTVPQIASDGAGGCIVTWQDYRNLNYSIYAQRIDVLGSVLWAADGLAICTGPGSHSQAMIASLGTAGAIIAWYDDRSGAYDIYAQRVSNPGSVAWTVNGIALCRATGIQSYARVVADGTGGAIVTWMDSRDGDYDVYGQRVDTTGVARWRTDGAAICTASGNQLSPEIVPDGSGGVIVVWEDGRIALSSDIYAERMYANGRLPWPRIAAVQDVPDDQGGKLHIVWNASSLDVTPSTEITHYSVWRRLDVLPALAFQWDWERSLMSSVSIDGKGPTVRLSSNGYSWEWLADVPARYFESYALLAVSLSDSMGADPGWQYFMVTAHTATQFVFYDSQVDSGYSVDNLSPMPPAALVAEQSYLPMGLQLTWDVNPESDLSHYAVYRGLSADFVPEAGNRVATRFDAECFDSEWRWDSEYYYKISALDVHGNESGFSLISPEEVTGNENAKIPITTYLSQNCPNPFNPITRIAFGLSARAHVSLRIYDVTGRLVRALVESDRGPGHYQETWNGKDGEGRSVSSGTYFYRLKAGSFTETKKMILLR